MSFKKKMRHIGSKALAGALAAAMMLSPMTSTTVFAAGNEDTNSGEQGVSITLNASQTDVDPGSEFDYTVTVSTTEYTGEANVVLSLDETITAVEATSSPIQRGMISGQGTSTITFKMTEFKPDDPDVVLKVKAKAPDDLNTDEEKTATATISYGDLEGDGGALAVSAKVSINAKEAFPTKGATDAKVTMTQTEGESSIVPGSKVQYTLSAAMSSEIETVTDVEDVKLHIDIPSEFTGVDVTGYKNGAPFAGSFTEGIATADFGTVRISDELKMIVDVTIPEDCTFQDFEFKGYASGSEVTSDSQTLTLSTTETIERLQDEPSVYLTWKDLNSTKDREYRTSDVMPVSIMITNRDSKQDMHDVVVTMPVPEGFNVIEDLDAEGIISDKTTFTWHIEKIEKGEKFTIDLGFIPTAGKVSDTFAASAKIAYLNHPLDGSAELTTNELKATREIPEADVLGIKVLQNNTDKEIVTSAGQNVAYSVTVVNNGDVDLKNVVLEGEIGAGLIYGKSNKTSVVQEDGIVTWTIDELKAGKSQTMMFGVTLPKASLANSYSFFMEGKADDTAEAKSNTVTMKTGSSDVTIEMYQRKSGMDEGTKNDMTVNYGETYTYVIVVKNEGTAVADSVTATTMIPGSLTLNQSSLTKGMTYNSSALKWNISDLEPGATKKASINVTAPTGAVSTNTSTSSSTTVKKMTLNVNSSIAWTDTAGNPGASDSNTVATTIEMKSNTVDNNNNNNNNNSNNTTKPVNNSGLDTVAVSKTTGNQMLAYQDKDTVHVTAKYTKLQANTHYEGTVGLVNESGGVIKQADGSNATVSVDFTTSSSGMNGAIGEFDFVVDGKAYAGKCLYAAINVTPDTGSKCAYNGVGFDQSTIRSATVKGAAVSYPSVSTSKTAQASVAVGYTNVQKGLGYQATATIIDRSTGKALTKSNGKEVNGTVDFKATENKGQIDVPIVFGADDVNGKDLAVYVTLYDANGKVVLAMDQDMNSTRTSGTTLASNSSVPTSGNTAKNNAKGDNTLEVVKTGEISSVSVIVVLLVLCAVSGAGYLLYKKREMLQSLLKKKD